MAFAVSFQDSASGVFSILQSVSDTKGTMDAPLLASCAHTYRSRRVQAPAPAMSARDAYAVYAGHEARSALRAPALSESTP